MLQPSWQLHSQSVLAVPIKINSASATKRMEASRQAKSVQMGKLSFLTAKGYVCKSALGVKTQAKKLILWLVLENAWMGRVLLQRANAGYITPKCNHQPKNSNRLEEGKTRTLESFKLN